MQQSVTCLRQIAVATMMAMGLAACSHEAPRQEFSAVPLTGTGYEADISTHEQVLRETWLHGEDRVEVSLHLPEAPAHVPLVLFLPGFGDQVDTAAPLHAAWAQAGYAVLAVQSPRFGLAGLAGAPRPGGPDGAKGGDGAKPPAEPGAHKGEKPPARDGTHGPGGMGNPDGAGAAMNQDAARQAFSVVALRDRLATLDWVMQELRRRTVDTAATSAPYRRIDLQRVVLAGFDLGAQTAQAAAGEDFGSTPLPASLGGAFSGFILLSPYATFAGPSAQTRYATMSLPSLSVTSHDDVDEYDMQPDANLRRLPFDRMPAGSKYLLTLAYASHSVIGGGPARERRTDGPGSSRSGNKGRGGPGGMPGGMSGGHPLAMGPGGGDAPGGGGPGGGAPDGEDEQKLPDAATQADQAKALRAVTLAFLDTTLRGDEIAHQWLTRDVNRWLKQHGEVLAR